MSSTRPVQINQWLAPVSAEQSDTQRRWKARELAGLHRRRDISGEGGIGMKKDFNPLTWSVAAGVTRRKAFEPRRRNVEANVRNMARLNPVRSVIIASEWSLTTAQSVKMKDCLVFTTTQMVEHLPSENTSHVMAGHVRRCDGEIIVESGGLSGTFCGDKLS